VQGVESLSNVGYSSGAVYIRMVCAELGDSRNMNDMAFIMLDGISFGGSVGRVA
jgi:hypothetical protein